MSTKQEQQLLKIDYQNAFTLVLYSALWGEKIGESSKLHGCLSETYEQNFLIMSSSICSTTVTHVTQDTRMI